ncbi:MAG: hypothetical protein J1F66_05675 [Clostridiales bacterium]|nr:hypothetical protein [Clostridiales bacterium]
MSKILNTFLSALALFFLCFAWIYYCLKDDILAFALSAIVALCSSYLIWKSLSRIDAGKKTKQAEKNALSGLVNFLRFGADNAAIFEEMLRYYRFEVERQSYDSLIVTKNGQKSYVAINFSHDSLNKDELRDAVISAKRADCTRLYIFTAKADSSLVAIANGQIHTVIIDTQNTYALFEQCDKLPSISPKKAPKKATFIARYAFNRRRFGWYFASSLFMLLISVISYFPWYSLGWATVFFALAVYSLVNKRFNVAPTCVSLD